MSMPKIESSKTSRCQAITDVIESVALEQTALSHILNAEGEKLQKFLCMGSATHQMILDANHSVHEMVESVARLETELQSKLSLFSDCLCDRCPKPCHETPPCHKECD